MRLVERWQTADGALHETERDAREYAENRYRLAVDRLAHEAVRACEKYVGAQEFIEASIDEFARLAALRADCELEEGEDGEW